jgi:hypothetical protein
MARLQMTTNAGFARRAGDTYPCALRAQDRDGHAYEVEILTPPGFSFDGPDASVVVAKFSRVTELALTADRRERIVETVMALEASPCCEGLFSALSSDQA